jgi:hypothetical protein
VHPVNILRIFAFSLVLGHSNSNNTLFEYDACDVTLSAYPHRASLKNMPGWCGYTLRVTSQASYLPEYITPTQKKSYLNSFEFFLGHLVGAAIQIITIG